MLKLLLVVGVEIFVGVLFAGVILALAIPLVNRSGLDGGVAAGIITCVLVGSVAVALFRPGSAVRRYTKR